MFRIAKAENFVLISPSKADVSIHNFRAKYPLLTLCQVGKQNAAECMPLIMEPYSAFYKGPMIVLDFQSLYPSIMIAYNYCYSTCLGRIQDFKGKNKLGVAYLDNPPGLLSHIRDYLNSKYLYECRNQIEFFIKYHQMECCSSNLKSGRAYWAEC